VTLLPRHRIPATEGPSPLAFQTTHWSLVLAAGDGAGTQARRALEELCGAYWFPVYAHVRSRGLTPEDAADVTQAYFLRLVEKEVLRDVRPEHGRFRSFLLASLRNFLANHWDHERAAKRGGGRAVVELDALAAEERFRIEPSDGNDPEKIFERQWALAVLARAMEALKADAEKEGGSEKFESLRGCLTGDEAMPRYAELAVELEMSEGAVKVAVHRLRKRFGQLLRDEIDRTVADPEEREAELRHLLEVVG
jgi:RNA polymerase sigma-70 factor (ECF subfamily)